MNIIEKEDSLLRKIVEMENLLYWKYVPVSGSWEFSTSFRETVCQGTCEKVDGKELFLEYISFMEPADQQKMMDLLDPEIEIKEGVRHYPVRMNGKRYFHKCAYFEFQENDVAYLMGLISDVTVEKREFLRNRNIIEAMSDFIFIINDQYYICDVMKSDLVQLFHSTEQLVGSHLSDIYSSQVTELFKEAIQNCLRTRSLQEISYPLIYRGQDTYYNLRMVPYEPDKVLAFIHEVTDKIKYSHELIKARKKAEEENLLKSTFLADISHEIRTSLNVIVGFSGLMAQSDEQEERESYMEIVHRSDAQLLDLIGDVLDFSRIEQGKLRIHKEHLNLGEVLKEVVTACGYSSDHKEGVEFVLDIPDQRVEVFTDRNSIMQVLHNLYSNAVLNTQSGTITIRLREEESEVVCEVIDTGKGIPSDKLGQIFDRFQKVDENVKGSGLGLSISKSLIEHLGGAIEVQSEEGKGSVFSFRLPKGDDQLAIPLSTSNLDTTEKTIYVLTEVESSFMLLNEILQSGYSVHWVSDPNVLRNKFQNAIPDMILINQEKPLSEVCGLVSEIRGMAVQNPILMILAEEGPNEQDLLELLNTGVTGVLNSPFTRKEIMRLVDQLLD